MPPGKPIKANSKRPTMRWLLSAAVVLPLLSGCIAGTENQAVVFSLPSGKGGSDENTSPDVNFFDGVAAPGKPVNRPPVVELLADVLEGNAPLVVTFDLSAVDADNDRLRYVFTVGDNAAERGGLTQGRVTQRVFPLAGTYEAVLEVTDGTTTVIETVSIQVASAAEDTVQRTSAAGNDLYNRAPIGALRVNAVADDLLSKTFVLTGIDPDGDALSYTLVVGDRTIPIRGALTAPVSILHKYEDAIPSLLLEGRPQQVFLVVSDGDLVDVKSVTFWLGKELAPVGDVIVAPPAAVSSALMDVRKVWTTSEGGAEYAIGCGGSETCAIFDLAAGSEGKTYTALFSSEAPAATYYIDYYAGGAFEETIIVVPGTTLVTGVIPAGITHIEAYATGGINHGLHWIMPSPPSTPWLVRGPDGTCDGLGIVQVGPLYLQDRGDPPGTGFALGDGTWIYEESNGIAGLQVGAAGDGFSDCASPDTLIF